MARPSAFHHRCSASRMSRCSMCGSLLCKKLKGERRVSRTVMWAHVRPRGPSTSRVQDGTCLLQLLPRGSSLDGKGCKITVPSNRRRPHAVFLMARGRGREPVSGCVADCLRPAAKAVESRKGRGARVPVGFRRNGGMYFIPDIATCALERFQKWLLASAHYGRNLELSMALAHYYCQSDD